MGVIMRQYNTWGDYLAGCENVYEVESRVLKLCEPKNHLSDVIYIKDSKVVLRVYSGLDEIKVKNIIIFQGLDETLCNFNAESSYVDINIVSLGLNNLADVVSESCNTFSSVQDLSIRQIEHIDNFKENNKGYKDLEEEHYRLEKELNHKIELLRMEYGELLEPIELQLTFLEDNYKVNLESIFGYEKLKIKDQDLLCELEAEYSLVKQNTNTFELSNR